MPDVFLSYSREDQVTARRFADALQREGFNVWWDQALDAGESFDKVTEQALREARAVVVLWSKHAVDSRWVRAEATQADRFGTLVPVTIEPCNRPIMFELTHTADLSGWNGDVAVAPWRAFVEGLRRTVGKAAPNVPSTFAAPAASAANASASRPFPRAAIVWAVIAAAVLLSAGFYWRYQIHQGAAPIAEVDASVAVLPFRDMSPNKDQEYFADGVTEEILNALAGVRGLTVTARTSAFAFKGKDVSLREVGQKLGVAHILEGSVRKDGDQLRITAQLIDTRADAHLWSRTWDRPLQDVFKVQEEIAKAVADTLAVSLGVGEGARVPGMTRSVDAYDEFLAGVNAIQRLGDREQAITHFRRAVEIDPSYAYAWSALSDMYRNASSTLPDPPNGSWQQKSDAALAEAERLAPEAYYVKYGAIERSMRKGAWSEVGRLLDEIEASANRQGVPVDTDVDRIVFSLLVGRASAGVSQMEQVRKRNPLAAPIAWVLGEAYADAGNLQAALDEFDRGQKLEGGNLPQLWGTALVTALATGDRNRIEPRVDAMAGRSTTGIDIHAAMKPLLGRPVEALAELHRLRALPLGPQEHAAISPWAAYFGDPGLALEILREQSPRRNPNEILRIWRPIMKDVRKQPGFKDLVRNLGLVDYWREYGWGDFCKPVGETDFECN